MVVPAWMWIAAGCVTAIGLALLIWSLRGDRSRGRRRCPKCWYLMQGTPGLRCPECGREAKHERDLSKPRRRWRLAFIGLIICMLTGGSALTHHGYQQRWHWAVLPTFRTIKSESRDGIRIDWLETRDPDADDWQRIVQVHHRGRLIHEFQGFYFTTTWWPSTSPATTLSNASNWLMLIVTEESGGTGCYAKQHVFAVVGDALELLDVIPYCGDFQDLDCDGVPEFIARDRTFAYWVTSGANSPYPRVVLRWQESKGFEPALDLMRGPVPSDAELLQRLAAYRNAGEQWHSRFAAAFEVTLDLIYSGHEDRAWTFLHDHWPHDPDGLSEDEFARDLKLQLRTSPFWPSVFALNRDTAIRSDEAVAVSGEP